MHAIYARVSTDEQARSGFSLGDQLSTARNRLLSLGLTPIKEYIDDGYSGEFLERPALDRLRGDLRTRLIQTVLVYDPDRLSRNLTNQLLLADEIEKAGAALLFITGNYDCSPEGRLFFSIRGAISAFEKAKIRERTLRGKQAKARQGKIVLNNKPYGFSWDAAQSTYLINEEEAGTVRLIYDLCLNNHWGSPQITAELTQRGIYNRSRKPFNSMHIYRILTKELYCGLAYSSKIATVKTGQSSRKTIKRPPEEWIAIPVPAIISRAKWEKAQQVIKENYSLAKGNTKRNYLLRGLVRCGVCGNGLVASHTKDTRIRYYYRCITKSSPQYQFTAKCKNRYIPVAAMEEAVWKAITHAAASESTLSDFIRTENVADHSAEIRELTRQQEEIRRKQVDVMKWYKANILDHTVAETELQSAAKELNTLKSLINNLQTAQEKIRNAVSVTATEVIQAATFEQKRAILLQSGINIYISRLGDNLEFWFKQK